MSWGEQSVGSSFLARVVEHVLKLLEPGEHEAKQRTNVNPISSSYQNIISNRCTLFTHVSFDLAPSPGVFIRARSRAFSLAPAPDPDAALAPLEHAPLDEDAPLEDAPREFP